MTVATLDEMPEAPDAPREETAEAAPAWRTDSLADSILILLMLAVVQRLVGFLRGVLFCRWLEPEQLGTWDMAWGFLVLAPPLVVLGLPGSFGRYLEYFRQRGHLKTVLRRTAAVSGLLSVCGAAALWLFAPRFSELIFNRTDETNIVLLLAGGLVAVIAYNFLVELLTALRMIRIVSRLQFGQSLGFALLAIGLLIFWQANAMSVVLAYVGACVMTCMWATLALRRAWRAMPSDAGSLSHQSLWAKWMPFAVWMWVTNMITNTFDLADRYMIVHWSSLDPDAALVQVGHYHSSRIMPLLMVAVAAMLGATITPHLSQDWESGRRQAVSDRLNLALKLLGLVLFAGSTAILLIAPVLFSVAFNGKYYGGLAVIPWTVTYCAWGGLTVVAQNYLWCAERARLGSLALLVGLLLNVGLNTLLLPHFGLHGAVWATAAANAATLTLVLSFAKMLGMRIDRGVVVIALLPLALSFGPWVSLAVLAGVTWEVCRRRRLFSGEEKQRLLRLAERYWGRFQESRQRKRALRTS